MHCKELEAIILHWFDLPRGDHSSMIYEACPAILCKKAQAKVDQYHGAVLSTKYKIKPCARCLGWRYLENAAINNIPGE